MDRNSPQFTLRTSSTHSLLQAWLMRTHGDLCGANSRDGRSLYPLQWMVSEAIKLGLVLGFQRIVWYDFNGDEKSIQDPTKNIFPDEHESQRNQGPFELEVKNGISVLMRD